jgi:hypothetical protein
LKKEKYGLFAEVIGDEICIILPNNGNISAADVLIASMVADLFEEYGDRCDPMFDDGTIDVEYEELSSRIGSDLPL